MRQGADDPGGHSQLHSAVQWWTQTDRTRHRAGVSGHRQPAVPSDRVGTRSQVLAQSPRRRLSPAAENCDARDLALSMRTEMRNRCRTDFVTEAKTDSFVLYLLTTASSPQWPVMCRVRRYTQLCTATISDHSQPCLASHFVIISNDTCLCHAELPGSPAVQSNRIKICKTLASIKWIESEVLDGSEPCYGVLP